MRTARARPRTAARRPAGGGGRRRRGAATRWSRPPRSLAAEDEPELRSTRRPSTRPGLPRRASRTRPVLLVHGTGPTPRENFGWNLLPQLARTASTCAPWSCPPGRWATSRWPRSTSSTRCAPSTSAPGAGRRRRPLPGRAGAALGDGLVALDPRWSATSSPSPRPTTAPWSPTSPAPRRAAGRRCTRCGPARLPEALHAQEDLSEVDVTSLGSVHGRAGAAPETIELEGASNIILQDVCPARPVTHLSIVADALAYGLLLDAFDHDGARTRPPARRHLPADDDRRGRPRGPADPRHRCSGSATAPPSTPRSRAAC
jgi:hypothetical protein